MPVIIITSTTKIRQEQRSRILRNDATLAKPPRAVQGLDPVDEELQPEARGTNREELGFLHFIDG